MKGDKDVKEKEILHGGDIYTHPGVLDFSSNSNPFGPGRDVIEAAKRGVLEMGHYPDSHCRRLREALSEKAGVPSQWLIFGNGAAELLYSFVWAVRPRRALLTAPGFSEYAKALQAEGCEIQYVYLEKEKNFVLPESFLSFLTEEIDVLFLCSPDNPTGQVIEKALLQKILTRCKKVRIRLLLDECFWEFLPQEEVVETNLHRMGGQVTIENLRQYSGLFLLRAFTKMHAMPGLRLGYGISSDRDLLKRMEEVRQPWSVSVAAQEAGIAALSEDERVKYTREYLTEERKWMEKELKALGIVCFPSAANYILLESPYDLFALLLEEGILIRDCRDYVGLKKGYYRVAVRLHEENVRLLLALKKIYYAGGKGGEGKLWQDPS